MVIPMAKRNDYADSTTWVNFSESVVLMISLNTQRFGSITRAEDAVIQFPGGIFGFELCRRWLLLSDQAHGALFWLQSVDQVDLSLSVVDPREYLPDYSLRVDSRQLYRIWTRGESLIVLSVLTRLGERLVLNLKSPILINPSLSIGRQVLASGVQPFQFELPLHLASTKQCA